MEDDESDSEYIHSDLVKCGITLKSQHGPIVEGIVKARYSDFYVKEIGLDKICLCLNKLNYQEIMQSEADDFIDFSNIPTNIIEQLDVFSQNNDLIEIKIKCENDKNMRTIIHKYIRMKYQKLVSQTNQTNASEIVVNKLEDKIHSQRSLNERWNKNLPEYTEFYLYKENMSTNDAISFLCNSLRVNHKCFSYCGVKDKRGITVQRVCAQRIHPPTIISTMEKYYKKHTFDDCPIILGNFSRKAQPLKLGDLCGNSFQIIIRDLRFPNLEPIKESDINTINESMNIAINSIIKLGFPNFFGKQRFGVGSVATYLIGISILKCDWEMAVDYILTERHKMPLKLRLAIREWKDSRDSTKAGAFIKNSFRHLPESCVLNKLKLSNNKINESSLSMIVYGTQLMYLHSFQSYIWNSVLSKRIETFGKRVLVGDLIMKEGESEPYILKADDLSNQQDMDISRIVHPLPGFDIKYPENEIKDWYFDFYKFHGVEPSTFQHKVKRYRLPGSYRFICVIPDSLSYDLLKYSGDESLILTDKDTLSWPIGLEHMAKTYPANDSINQSQGRDKLALLLKFNLPPSCYATTLINELVMERKHKG